MKHITATLFAFFISTIVFSSPSYAEWFKVAENVNGDTFYVDVDRIREHDGYVYFWSLRDYLKPDQWGDFSSKNYRQGDCNLFRFKALSSVFHKQPMGGDVGDIIEPIGDNANWEYPAPNTVNERILSIICSSR